MTGRGGGVHYSAPGRINLIGEHTDYNDGYALPIALPERTVVTFYPDDSDSMVVRSDREADAVRFLLDTTPGDVGGWAAYVAGVVWALQQAGHPVPGGSMSISGGVEVGAGLASSAALECAALGAILAATGRRLDRMDQARIARCAENEYVGAPTGLMDQLAVLFGEPNAAQLIDFRHHTTRSVAFDPDAHGMALLLINSHATHRHAGGDYAARRASCEKAAAALGVASLRDVQDLGVAVLPGIPDALAARRARHILTENQRVLATVEALQRADFTEVGQLLTESHASMRDDFEITTGQIDLIADSAVQAGAVGTRMTGGGFGGCVIALVNATDVDTVAAAVRHAVTRAGYRAPTIMRTRPSRGAG